MLMSKNVNNDVSKDSPIELKLCTVVTLMTKFHGISIVTFPWQHNILQALSIQRVKSAFASFKKRYLLLLIIQWV